MDAPTCDYCGEPAVLADSAEVYGGRSYGMIWLCRPCQAWVGCHRHTDRPLGRLANAELRQWKMKAHTAFDQLWKIPPRLLGNRSNAYAWLAERLRIEPKHCHIGMFDVATCKRVVEVCETL